MANILVPFAYVLHKGEKVHYKETIREKYVISKRQQCRLWPVSESQKLLVFGSLNINIPTSMKEVHWDPAVTYNTARKKKSDDV